MEWAALKGLSKRSRRIVYRLNGLVAFTISILLRIRLVSKHPAISGESGFRAWEFRVQDRNPQNKR